jgi:pimeloyl-ACP methyl ester carboxylesterase
MTFHASNGSVVHLEETGEGPTILCLHGLGGGAYFFEGFAVRLRSRYRICAVDLPGTRRSSAPDAAFSMEGWVETFGELLTHHFQSSAVVLGHSMSVILALKLCCAFPTRVSSLILVGGLPEARPLMRDRLTKRAEHVSRNGMAGLGRAAAPGNFAPTTLKNQPALVAQFERQLEALNAETYLRCIRILLGASAVDLVRIVRAPCLVLSGNDDQYAPTEDVSKFAQNLPNLAQQVMLPDCGHLPFLETPDAFGSVVRQFLEMERPAGC